MSSTLLLYISPPLPSPLLLSLSSSPIDSPPPYPIMSQHNLYTIIRQQQEQLAAMQAQIQALLTAAGEGARGEEWAAQEANRGYQMEVAKLAIFSGEAGKVEGFIMVYRLYLKMKMREATVKEQVQWVLSYIQRGSADIWKENVMEELEAGEIKYKTAEEFLMSLRKEFGGGEEESVKVVELRKLEQGGRMMEEFVREFKRMARGSRYEGRLLMEEFKREINGGIRRKLMEAKNPLASIEQWYKKATVLDRNWRESRKEKKRLREKKEIGGGTQK